MSGAATAGPTAANGVEAVPVAGVSSPETAAPLVQVRGGFGGGRPNRGRPGRLRYFRPEAPRGCPPGRSRIRGNCQLVR